MLIVVISSTVYEANFTFQIYKKMQKNYENSFIIYDKY